MTTKYNLTAEEAFDSLNGYDEIAIKQAFGQSVDQLAKKERLTFARSLVFIMERRAGNRDGEAHKTALEMTLGQVQAAFLEEPDEPMPDLPVSDVGKDDTQTES